MLDPGIGMHIARIVVAGVAGLFVLMFLLKFVQFYMEARAAAYRTRRPRRGSRWTS